MSNNTQTAIAVLKAKRAALLEQANALTAVLESLGSVQAPASTKKAAKKGKGGSMAAAHAALAKKRAAAKASEVPPENTAQGASLSEAAAQ